MANPEYVAPIPENNPQPQIIIQQSGGSILWKIVAGLGWLGILFCVPIILALAISSADYYNTTEGVTEKYYQGDKTASDKIAVIDVSGVIMEGEGYVKHQIDLVREDKSVKAVVVRVNTPGGTVTGSDYILHHLKKLHEDRDIPLVVSMGAMATSGGYYVAMAVEDQEDSIYAEPTTTTGSIGVIVPHYDISGLMDEYNIKDDSIMSHPRKQMLTMTRSMPEEHREIIQNYVNQAFGRFKEIVQSGRPKFEEDPAALDKLATGEIFTAQQALASGLVDKIGFVEEAIERAAELADIDAKKSRVVRYTAPVSLFSFGSMQQRPMNLQSLLEMSTPQAYYLCSYVPPVFSSYARNQD